MPDAKVVRMSEYVDKLERGLVDEWMDGCIDNPQTHLGFLVFPNFKCLNELNALIRSTISKVVYVININASRFFSFVSC